jgi:hypothetical protein
MRSLEQFLYRTFPLFLSTPLCSTFFDLSFFSCFALYLSCLICDEFAQKDFSKESYHKFIQSQRADAPLTEAEQLLKEEVSFILSHYHSLTLIPPLTENSPLNQYRTQSIQRKELKDTMNSLNVKQMINFSLSLFHLLDGTRRCDWWYFCLCSRRDFSRISGRH